MKYSFHKAAIVERRQDQNYNVEPGYCLPTGQQVSAAALPTTDMQTALCLYVHVHGCTLKPFVFIHYTSECSQTGLFQ